MALVKSNLAMSGIVQELPSCMSIVGPQSASDD